MEGNGSNFRRFGSSRTRLGSAPDASLKSLGARLEANAAFRRGVLRQCRRGWSVCLEMAPQRLEEIDSAPGNGMASEGSHPQDLVRGAFVNAPAGRVRRAHRARLKGAHGLSADAAAGRVHHPRLQGDGASGDAVVRGVFEKTGNNITVKSLARVRKNFPLESL